MFEAVPKQNGHRIGLYGPGGIGKTSLALLAPPPVRFMDLDDSLGVLGVEAERVAGDLSWTGIRTALQAPGWEDTRTIVIDSATAAEERCAAWVIANVPHDKGHAVKRLEDYGYGKGYQHIYETWLLLLADLDRHIREGRNVVLTMHDCTATVPNPAGDDYLRFEPRLQTQPGGKASVRYRVREWLDHLLFIGYDVEVNKRKGKGSGTRTIYPAEMPFCMAKSRGLENNLEFTKDSPALWDALFEDGTDA